MPFWVPLVPCNCTTIKTLHKTNLRSSEETSQLPIPGEIRRYLVSTELMRMRLWTQSTPTTLRKAELPPDTRLDRSSSWRMMLNSLPVPCSSPPTSWTPTKYPTTLPTRSRMPGTTSTRTTRDGLDMKRPTLSRDTLMDTWTDSMEPMVQSPTSPTEDKPTSELSPTQLMLKPLSQPRLTDPLDLQLPRLPSEPVLRSDERAYIRIISMSFCEWKHVLFASKHH